MVMSERVLISRLNLWYNFVGWAVGGLQPKKAEDYSKFQI